MITGGDLFRFHESTGLSKISLPMQSDRPGGPCETRPVRCFDNWNVTARYRECSSCFLKNQVYFLGIIPTDSPVACPTRPNRRHQPPFRNPVVTL